MNDCGSVLAYTTKEEKQQRHEMCREMKQKSSGNFIISGTPKNLLVLVTHRLKLLLALVLGDLLATLFLEVAHF